MDKKTKSCDDLIVSFKKTNNIIAQISLLLTLIFSVDITSNIDKSKFNASLLQPTKKGPAVKIEYK